MKKVNEKKLQLRREVLAQLTSNQKIGPNDTGTSVVTPLSYTWW